MLAVAWSECCLSPILPKMGPEGESLLEWWPINWDWLHISMFIPKGVPVAPHAKVAFILVISNAFCVHDVTPEPLSIRWDSSTTSRWNVVLAS